jgi:hypothetical protein
MTGCINSDNRMKVSITTPTDGTTIEEFIPLAFTGIATDKEHVNLTGASLTWTSSIGGYLGTGTLITVDHLSAGDHIITLTATDVEGNVESDSISVTVNLATGLIPRGNDYPTFYGDWSFENSNFLWASVTVRDENGNDITGLGLDNFTIKESIVTTTGEQITESHEVNINLQKEDDWEPQWFWEESLGNEKMDVVFLVETRGTMEDSMPGIRSQIHQFVSRLATSHIDFRVAGVAMEETPNWDYFDFHGSGEMDRLNQDIDSLFTSDGTWWNPVDSYDPLLWTPWLGFRENAQKVCVIITDILPQTVYDTFWYSGGCTAATRSAVELFLQSHPDIKLYYCLNPAKPIDIEYFANSDINPMAGNDIDKEGLGSGFGALESDGFATSLPWPFDQSHITLTSVPITDSRYYFVWEQSFSWDDWDMVSEHPEDYRVLVSLEVTLPDTGKPLTTTFDYPITKQAADINFHFTDEKGNNLRHWASANLDYYVGDRAYPYDAQLSSEEGPTTVAAGTYYLKTEASGGTVYSLGTEIEDLRLLDRRVITVPPEGLTLNIQVTTADRESQLLRARGLLQDLKDNWRQPGAPFREYVAVAESWLDEIDRNGIDWVEMVRLKRFTVALSGYANLVEYAQQEIEKSSENVQEIIADFQKIIEQVVATESTFEKDWDEQLEAIVLDVALDILTAGDFSALKETVEEGLKELLEYAGGQLLDELKDMVCAELADKDYRELLCTLIDVAADLPKAADEGDWSAIMEPLQELPLNVALDQARGLIADNFVDVIFNNIDLGDQLENDLSGFVKDILTAMTSESGFDHFDQALQKFIHDVIDDVGEQSYAQNREQIVAAINDIFEQLKDKSDEVLAGHEGAGLVRDFLIGMAQDMALAALPQVNSDGDINYNPDADALAKVLIKNVLYNLFLKEYFVDEASEGLKQILQSAKSFTPQGDDPDQWVESMSEDFWNYWNEMDSLQETAWNALETQEDVENWAEGLQGLVDILEPVKVALDALAAIYPPMEDTAEAVDKFITVLDGIQIIPEAVEFALRVDSLDTFGNEAEPLYLKAFGKYEE